MRPRLAECRYCGRMVRENRSSSSGWVHVNGGRKWCGIAMYRAEPKELPRE